MSTSHLFHLSREAADLQTKLERFVIERCQPAEKEYESHIRNRGGKDRWTSDAIPPCLERLKAEAKALGLWNLFLPHPLPNTLLSNNTNTNNNNNDMTNLSPPAYLSNREYGILCETMGKSFLTPEACNCSAPDTGNMEVLLKFGTPLQQNQYLLPLLSGTIRSAFLMTEPNVASSDATNIRSTLLKTYIDDDGSGGGGGGGRKVKYILNGNKWWSTGAMDPRCRVLLILAKMDYSHPSCVAEMKKNQTAAAGGGTSRHGAHTVVVVSRDHPGVRMVRPLTAFGYDDAPHGHAEVALENVVLDSSSLILGEGKGFEIAQERLGPGRIHHCMRAVGQAARCFDLMVERALTRKTFGKYLWEHGGCQEMIADSASDVEAARLLTLSCAAAIDEHGPRAARDKIASIKVTVPELTLRVVDRAVQVFGGAGVSGDFPLARLLAGLRGLRIADGPDAVHKRTVALIEVKKAKKRLKEFQSRL